MKAWLLDELAGIERLRLADVPDPKPADGQVLLAVHYAALNPADRYLAEKQYSTAPPLPHVLGRDGMGTVVETGHAVSGFRPGDRLMILRGEVGVSRWGTFAEKVVVPAESLTTLPPGWTEQQAAGATLVYLTAYQALTMWGDLPPSVILVSGASGGVGVASVQLGKAMGHRVIALSRSDDKRRQLIALGAAGAFDPSEPRWRDSVKDFLSGKRVDLAIDNIGGRLLPEMIDTLADQGKVSVVGRLAGPVPQFNTASLLFRRIRIGGVAVGAYSNHEIHQAWTKSVELLNRIGARPLVDSVYPFDRLPDAFGRLAEGPMGKVLLAVGVSGGRS